MYKDKMEFGEKLKNFRKKNIFHKALLQFCKFYWLDILLKITF